MLSSQPMTHVKGRYLACGSLHAVSAMGSLPHMNWSVMSTSLSVK